ncbi:MAG: EamA family transporter [Nitrospirae bacterium]|nr:EamA family transporter [Nitrospirota bacterium]
MVILSLIVAILLNATANILIKIGMNKTGGLQGLGLADILAKMLSNYVLWAGCMSFALALFAYSYALSKINLSIAYPIMTSLGYIIVILSSVFFLKESFSVVQAAGVMVIILGVWMVAR